MLRPSVVEISGAPVEGAQAAVVMLRMCDIVASGICRRVSFRMVAPCSARCRSSSWALVRVSFWQANMDGCRHSQARWKYVSSPSPQRRQSRAVSVVLKGWSVSLCVLAAERAVDR